MWSYLGADSAEAGKDRRCFYVRDSGARVTTTWVGSTQPDVNKWAERTVDLAKFSGRASFSMLLALDGSMTGKAGPAGSSTICA